MKTVIVILLIGFIVFGLMVSLNNSEPEKKKQDREKSQTSTFEKNQALRKKP